MHMRPITRRMLNGLIAAGALTLVGVGAGLLWTAGAGLLAVGVMLWIDLYMPERSKRP